MEIYNLDKFVHRHHTKYQVFTKRYVHRFLFSHTKKKTKRYRGHKYFKPKPREEPCGVQPLLSDGLQGFGKPARITCKITWVGTCVHALWQGQGAHRKYPAGRISCIYSKGTKDTSPTAGHEDLAGYQPPKPSMAASRSRKSSFPLALLDIIMRTNV